MQGMQNISMSFGERVRRLREERGWSQLDLAIQLDTDQSTAWRIENNKSYPVLDTPKERGMTQRVSLKSLARVFGLSVVDLLRGTAYDESPIALNGFLRIDPRPLEGEDALLWDCPLADFMTVSAFIDFVYHTIGREQQIPPYSYGRAWAFRDATSGQILLEMGRRWAAEHGLAGDMGDPRPLESVGLKAGMCLEIIALSNAP